MKKRFAISLISVLMLVVASSFVIAGCRREEGVTPAQAQYTVTFKDGDTVLKSREVDANATAVYVGAAPTKERTAQYSYAFLGWALTDGGEVIDLSSYKINKPTTFYAVFEQTLREYEITWIVEGVPHVYECAYGREPEYKGTPPVKAPTIEWEYTFSGWSTSADGEKLTSLPVVVGEATYYAVFTRAARKYTITWVIEGKNYTSEAAYGTVPTYDGTPEKAPTTVYEYTFNGWSLNAGGEKLSSLPEVKGEATYYALFEQSVRKYTITWVIDGTPYTSKCEYGYYPEYDGETPEKASTEWKYEFGGWALSSGGARVSPLPQVLGEATYYAVFNKVEFLGGDILYSTQDGVIFYPKGLLDAGEEVVSAVGKVDAVDYYNDGTWSALALELTEIQNNDTRRAALTLTTSFGKVCGVNAVSYAGVIDELSDFEAFFNEPASGTASSVYGYYAVIKDLGTVNGSGVPAEAVTLSQTNGAHTFNGILDGQGHTLTFNLRGDGGLVGYNIGTATVKNLAVFFNDYSTMGYGLFGREAVGAFTVDNCYIELLNEKGGRTTYGIMDYPHGKLVITNSVIYGYTTTSNNTYQGGTADRNAPSAASKNAFVIHARTGADGWAMSTNFTKVFADNLQNGAREVSLLEIADASGFNAFWRKDGVLTWQGAETDVQYTAVTCDDRYLVLDGQTEYAIIIPSNADSRLVGAKDELVSFFKEATGITLTVASDGNYSVNDKYISIGNTESFASSGVETGKIGSQGYRIKSVGNSIYIGANSSLGCLYGVYGLMEALFGYEQYSSDCYTINGTTTVKFPLLNITETPDFEIRLPVNGAVSANAKYANRLRTTDTTYVLRAGDYRIEGNGWTEYHNSFNIIPPSYWKSLKPNWFASSGNQLCYTAHGNQADYDALVAQIVDVMTLTLSSSQFGKSEKPEARYITLTTQDGNGVCTCSACKAAKAKYGSDVGAVIALCNDVRAGIEAWMNKNPAHKRELTLLLFAYNDYVKAPASYNAATGKYEFNGGLTMRPDVGVFYAVSDYANYYFDIYDSVNAEFRAQFDAWADVTTASGSPLCLWTYSQNFSHYMLRADVYGEGRFFNENAYAYFAAKNIETFFNQGPSNIGNTISSFGKLNAYIDAQMMWDSTQSVEALISDWFNAMYGAGAIYMKQLYTAQNSAARSMYGTTKKGIPTVSVSSTKAKTVLTSATLTTWLGYITSAKNAVNGDVNLSSAQKSAALERIDEEWIAVKFWQAYLYRTNLSAAAEEFRAVLGYDASTRTYKKDLRILENTSYSTLGQWIDSNFKSDLKP